MHLPKQGQDFVKFGIIWTTGTLSLLVCSYFESRSGRTDVRFLTNIPLFCRFADFVEGSFHLTPNEVSVHEQEYGLGSIFTQDEELSSEEEGSEYPTFTQNNFLT